MRLAPRLPTGALSACERLIAAGIARCGPGMLGAMVRGHMRAAGVYGPWAERPYFEQVGLHLASVLPVLKYGLTGATGDAAGSPDDRAAPECMAAIEAAARDRLTVDDSIRYLHEAAAAGRGAILAPAHVSQFLLGLARMGREVPLTVYLRYSKNEAARIAKHAWCRAAGLRIIAEASRVTDPGARAERLAAALHAGQVLVITPDIPQRVGRGATVRLLGRRMQLASGIASLSLLTGAPIIPLTGRPLDTRRAGDRRYVTCNVLHPPLSAPDLPRGRGRRRESMEALMQQWADHFAAFLQAHPHLWFPWIDTRWSRVWRCDPKYATPL